MRSALILMVLVAAVGAGRETEPDLNDATSHSAAIVERTGCLGDCPSYEAEIHADGRVIWRGREDVAIKGTREGHADPAVVTALFKEVFPNSEREICIYERGVDAPIYYILFLRTGDLDELRKQRDELFRLRQSDPTVQEPCSIQERFDDVIGKLEQAADSHRWLHGRESILDRTKVGEDIEFGTKPRFSLLMRMAGKGELAKVNGLLQNQNVDAADETGWTALLVASTQCQSEIVATLLSAGANPNWQDENGDTPLIAAASSNCWRFDTDKEPRARHDLIRQLVGARAGVNQANRTGVTPLMVAARFANPEAVQALLESNAEPKLRDNLGVTAMGYADKYGRRVPMYNRSSQQEYFRRFREVRKLLSRAAAQPPSRKK